MMYLKSRWKILKLNWGLSRVIYFPVGSNLLLVVDLSTAKTWPKFGEHFSGRIRFGLIQRTDASRKRRDELCEHAYVPSCLVKPPLVVRPEDIADHPPFRIEQQ